MKQCYSFLFPSLFLVFCLTGCVISSDDEPTIDIPQMMLFTAKVDKMEAIKSCEGDGTTGKGDIYTRLSLHKNNEPYGSSWGTLAEVGEIVVELSRGQSIINPGIEVSKEIEPFDSMRVEYSLFTREVDPSGTQVQKSVSDFMVYDAKRGCWLEETAFGYGDDCLIASNPGTSRFVKTMETHLTDHNCEIIITWTVSLIPMN